MRKLKITPGLLRKLGACSTPAELVDHLPITLTDDQNENLEVLLPLVDANPDVYWLAAAIQCASGYRIQVPDLGTTQATPCRGVCCQPVSTRRLDQLAGGLADMIGALKSKDLR